MQGKVIIPICPGKISVILLENGFFRKSILLDFKKIIL